jgi:hypothetical protein
VVNSVWRKENELKDLKTELAALDRKIQLSLKPVDQSEDKPEEKLQKNSDKNEDEMQKAIREIHALMSGELKPGDRPVTGSVPKYNSQSKGFRL